MQMQISARVFFSLVVSLNLFDRKSRLRNYMLFTFVWIFYVFFVFFSRNCDFTRTFAQINFLIAMDHLLQINSPLFMQWPPNLCFFLLVLNCCFLGAVNWSKLIKAFTLCASFIYTNDDNNNKTEQTTKRQTNVFFTKLNRFCYSTNAK